MICQATFPLATVFLKQLSVQFVISCKFTFILYNFNMLCLVQLIMDKLKDPSSVLILSLALFIVSLNKFYNSRYKLKNKQATHA